MKYIVILMLFVMILVHDIQNLKKLNLKTILVYTATMVIAAYESMIYVFDLKWPFLHDAVDALYGDTAARIFEFLKASPS